MKVCEIVIFPAFEEAGNLFYKATGMTISYHDEKGDVVFYPVEERCELCRLIQSTELGQARCQQCDDHASERALRTGRPIAYTCHAGLTDVVVPVVVGGERMGCFYSGQSLLAPQTTTGYKGIWDLISDLGLNWNDAWKAYQSVPVVAEEKLEVAMGLLSIISNHLVESEITLRQERELTTKQRKLRKSAEEKAILERDLREMELRLLQAQVNPHFLFNTLNLILGQSMAEGARETARLVEELSCLLRASLSSVGKMVSIEEEFASARAYIEVFRARFSRDIDVQISLPEELRRFTVPTLLIQPLVENALIHGLPKCTGRFRISMEASQGESSVTIRVSDNGPSPSPHEIKTIAKSLSLGGHQAKLTGLPGINRRLKYYYRDVPDLHVESADPGFSASLSIPLHNQG